MPVALLGALAAMLTIASSTPAARAGSAPTDASRVLLGRSVEGRPIRAVRLGPADAPRRALVVGNIHGDEPAGRRVVRALRARGALPGVALWLVDTVNPDGLARGRRQNARGVDLNRSFPARWRRSAPGSRYYGGPRPLSEPESRAIAAFVRRIRPDVSIWYHQPYDAVLLPCRGAASVQRRYAGLARMGVQRCRGAPLPGTVIRWENATLPGTTAFVVEFGPTQPSAGAVRRHARAAAIVARGL